MTAGGGRRPAAGVTGALGSTLDPKAITSGDDEGHASRRRAPPRSGRCPATAAGRCGLRRTSVPPVCRPGAGYAGCLSAGLLDVRILDSRAMPCHRADARRGEGRAPQSRQGTARRLLIGLARERHGTSLPTDATDCDRVVFHRSMDDAIRSDDAALAGRLAVDLDGTFEALVDAHAGRLFSIALRVIGDRSDAEEAAQDALVRAYRALAGYDPQRIREIRLRPWLATIVLNVCRNRTRVRRVRTVELAFEPAAEPAVDPLARRRREGRPGPRCSRPCRRPSERPSSCVTSTACPTPRWPRPSAGPREPSRPRSIAAWEPCAMRSSPPSGASARR